MEVMRHRSSYQTSRFIFYFFFLFALPQGHIALSRAIFPVGTPGRSLDTLARAPIWAVGLNYGHGTGIARRWVVFPVESH